MNSYLLYEPKKALCAFTATSKLQFWTFDPKGKIVQNIKFSSVSLNSDLISKLDSNRQHKSKGMLSFQSRASNIKLLKFHVNQDKRAYLEKCDFLRNLVSRFWDRHLIRGVEMSQRVVSVSDFESQLALEAKRDKIKLTIYRLSRKIDFVNGYKCYIPDFC